MRLITILSWLFVCSSLGACETTVEPAPDADTVVAFQLADGRPFVGVYVNRRGPYRFLIDNGADGVGRADVRLVEELELPNAGVHDNSDGVNVAQVSVVRVDSLTLGNRRMESVELLSRDYNRSRQGEPLMGILGSAFFADGVLELNFANQMLRFSETRALLPGTEGVMPYREPFRVPIQIGDAAFEANIDVGSNLTMHLPLSLLERLATGPIEEAGEARRANTTFQLYRGRLRDPVRIGALVIEGVEAVGSERAEEVNIGGGILRDAIVAIDQRNQLLSVTPAR